jgi:hypothetical protein
MLPAPLIPIPINNPSTGLTPQLQVAADVIVGCAPLQLQPFTTPPNAPQNIVSAGFTLDPACRHQQIPNIFCKIPIGINFYYPFLLRFYKLFMCYLFIQINIHCIFYFGFALRILRNYFPNPPYFISPNSSAFMGSILFPHLLTAHYPISHLSAPQ